MCYLTNRNIGQWKGEPPSLFLSSLELSELLFETFSSQPLFVIHVLWKRIIFNCSIPDDEIALMIFSLFSEFLSIYPMFKNSLFKLAILYENVTKGSQKVFLSNIAEYYSSSDDE